jgi:hypothetical protein
VSIFGAKPRASSGDDPLCKGNIFLKLENEDFEPFLSRASLEHPRPQLPPAQWELAMTLPPRASGEHGLRTCVGA